MHQKQKGQVLPLGLALVVFGMLGCFVLFNTGQVATDKMRLANTADAAAFSGTLWQARALNFQSYTNRAMVANQVSIAQAVTLRSWAAYGAVTSEQLAIVLGPVPVLNAVAKGLESGMRVVEKVVSPISQALLSVVDVVNQGLSFGQEAMFVSTFMATPDVIKSVVSETDERFSVETAFSGLGLANNLNQWRNFTTRYSEHDVQAMNERAAMINDSRDSFTRQRNWKFFDFWFYSTPITRHQIRREGDTRLIRVDSPDGIAWEWKAKDTMSLHNRIWRPFRSDKKIEVPIGWAEAFANSPESSRTIEPGACSSAGEMARGNCARFLSMNRKSEYLADIGMPSPIGTPTRIDMNGYTGVQAYRSLSKAAISEDAPRLSLKVEVGMSAEDIRGTQKKKYTGHFDAPVDTPGSRVSSISVAEVFYKRPDADSSTANIKLELANGYNPYWDSRLSPVPDADKLLAFALRPGAFDRGSSATPPDGISSNANSLGDYVESDSPLADEDSGAGVGSRSGTSVDAALAAGVLVHQIESSATRSGRDFAAVVDEFDVVALSGLEDEVEQRLTDVLEEQVKKILSAAISDHFGGTVETMYGDLKEQAQDAVQEFEAGTKNSTFVQTVSTAIELAEEYEAEFKRIRDDIVTDFSERFDTESQALDATIEPLIAEANRRQKQLDEIPRSERDKLSKQLAIDGIREKITAYRKKFKENLAVTLVDIVSEHTDLYVMPLRDAQYVVSEFLKLDESEISLPWLEHIEEDDQ